MTQRPDTAALAPDVVARLLRKASGERWSVSVARFGQALQASATKGVAPSDREHGARVVRYLESLHLEDLALACACADGHEAAWEHFVRELRPVLYRAADALDPYGGARELADAIYADLFGMKQTDGERASLFRYFHGRSSLATWLRAILAQRRVDRLRADRRTSLLPDDESPAALPATASAVDPDRVKDLAVTTAAIGHALGALAPRDRLRLQCYYAQGMTLAEMGKLFKEHEATASRHLARVRRDVRTAVERYLRDEVHLSPDEIARCFSSVSDDPGSLDIDVMLDSPRKNSVLDRSPEERPS